MFQPKNSRFRPALNRTLKLHCEIRRPHPSFVLRSILLRQIGNTNGSHMLKESTVNNVTIREGYRRLLSPRLPSITA